MPSIALRATRRPELQKAGVKGYVLDARFGHSAAVAAKYSLMATEEDSTAAVVTSVVTSQRRRTPPQAIKAQKNPGKTGVVMAAEGVGWADEYTPLDSNQ